MVDGCINMPSITMASTPYRVQPLQYTVQWSQCYIILVSEIDALDIVIKVADNITTAYLLKGKMHEICYHNTGLIKYL